MVKLVDRDNCVGCSACADRCGYGAISMEADEKGFLYPIINSSLCKECYACIRSCPQMTVKNCPATPIKSYIMQSKSDKSLSLCASGGFCTVFFAQEIERTFDCIVGAVYDNNFDVIHKECTNKKDVKLLSGSKYVQSTTVGVYKKIERGLKSGRHICFSGTPCQVAGLYSFLGKRYDNLVTIDFLCHSVPSPEVWRLYLKKQSEKKGNIIGVRFKSKKYGYSFPTLELRTEKNGKTKSYYLTSQADEFMSAFLNGRIARKSCNHCKYRNSHYSDITVADYYRFSEITPAFKKDAGISRVVVWTKKGQDYVDRVKDFFVWKEIDVNLIFNKDDFHDVKTSNFENDSLYQKESDLQKYLNVSWKAKSIGLFRVLLHKLGIQTFIKRIIKG